MRILVTGSRNWVDKVRVYHALNETARFQAVVVHGACPTGADAIASKWCQMQEDVTEEPHPAKWRRRNGSYDPMAGFKRNAEMVDLGADICLAFVMPCTKPNCPKRHGHPHDSHGTSHTIELARAAGITVKEFRP